MDLMSINVDELVFDCVYERLQDEIVHPETGETLRQDFPQSGYKIASQYPELFVYEFSQGGGYHYALDSRPGATPPSISFVLFMGDIRVAFDVTDDEKFAEDGITRVWEITHIAHLCGVSCFSPFSSMKGVKRERVRIAEPMKFSSREQQDQIVAIIIKALSSYNHKEEGKAVRLDGKEITEEEHKERIKLLLDSENPARYFEVYDRESWMVKIGPAKVTLTSLVTSSLEEGRYLL